MKKPFLKMTRDEQADIIRGLMEAGHSYASAAIEVGLNKKRRGLIAGICRDYDIKTTRSAGFEDLPKSSSGVVLRLAGSESTQCRAKARGHQCSYVRVEDSEYCALPAHQALEKRGR